MGCDCAKVKGRIQTVAHGKIFQFVIITLAGIEGLLVVTMLMLEIERLQSKVSDFLSNLFYTLKRLEFAFRHNVSMKC